MNMVRVRRLLLALAALVVLAQIFQPARTNPPIIESRTLKAHVEIPQPVQAILERACSDCHSNRTVWPWYSHVAPLSWFVVDDVNQGRRHLNFTDWEAQRNPQEASEHLGLICKELKTGAMPLFSYRLVHPKSRLSEQEIHQVCLWSEALAPQPANPPIPGHDRH